MYEVQGVRVDPTTRSVWVAEEYVPFSRKEFDLLHALISRAGEVVSRELLMREVWDTTFWTSSKTIDVHLGWVRRKLGDNSRRPHLISTLRGKGLRFELEPPQAAGRGGPAGAPGVAGNGTAHANGTASGNGTGTGTGTDAGENGTRHGEAAVTGHGGMDRTAASPWLQGQASDRMF